MEMKPFENFEELVKNGIKGKILEQKVTRLTEPGENYLSLVLKVDIKTQDVTGKEETIPAVAKIFPAPPKETKDVDRDMTKVFFKNEIVWYSQIIPALDAFQKENGFEGKYSGLFANIYGSRMSLDAASDVADRDAVIVMENLKTKGYENDDRFEGMDLHAAKLSLDALAVFHAVPMAMKLVDEERFEKQVKNRSVYQGPPPPPKDGEDHRAPSHEIERQAVERLLKEDEDCAAIFSHVEEYLKLEFVRDEPREPWNTLIHNDYWINNIMLKRVNGHATDVKIVDLQMTPYKSALSDLLFFLFTSVKTDVLKTNLDHLIRYYYDQFIANLKKMNVDTDVFAFEEFIKELKMVVKTELFHALLFMFIIFTPKDKAPKDGFDSSAIFDRETCQTQKERSWFVVKECVKRNWV